jgi:hypothetical protein
MRDIGDGAGLYLAGLAIRFAQEDGGRGVAVGDGGDIHAYNVLQKLQISKVKSGQ